MMRAEKAYALDVLDYWMYIRYTVGGAMHPRMRDELCCAYALSHECDALLPG